MTSRNSAVSMFALLFVAMMFVATQASAQAAEEKASPTMPQPTHITLPTHSELRDLARQNRDVVAEQRTTAQTATTTDALEGKTPDHVLISNRYPTPSVFEVDGTPTTAFPTSHKLVCGPKQGCYIHMVPYVAYDDLAANNVLAGQIVLVDNCGNVVPIYPFNSVGLASFTDGTGSGTNPSSYLFYTLLVPQGTYYINLNLEDESTNGGAASSVVMVSETIDVTILTAVK